MMDEADLKKLKNRIDRFCANRVNAFSPTISPAPKSPERNEIESIHEAVHYFRRNGVKEIVVQRKYMGSYCDIYLCRNLEDTYFVSRNAYRIDHIDMKAAQESCRELHARFDWWGLALVILQSELMPWSVLGKKLIDDEFIGYLNVHQNHFRHLSQSGLYAKIGRAKDSTAFKTFVADRETMNDREIAAKYPHHVIRQYDSLRAFKVLELDVYDESIRICEEQIRHFGREGAIYFKPFNVLKKVFDDDSELRVNDNLSYRDVNDDEFLHLSIADDKDCESAIERTYSWFAELSSNMEEGIVIKPRDAFVRSLPPAFKVRNNRYLTMIYGVTFNEQYDYYLSKRNISRKLECSVNDWTLNHEILKVNYRDVHAENYLLKNLVLDRIMGERIEATLDHRL
jgi:hypothetical protein